MREKIRESEGGERKRDGEKVREIEREKGWKRGGDEDTGERVEMETKGGERKKDRQKKERERASESSGGLAVRSHTAGVQCQTDESREESHDIR